jgi:sec-independent protein translocase protein TatB
MELFGVGASELIFILIIAIIVLGPKDMQRAGRTIGRWLNQLVRSDSWKVFQKTSAEIRNLPRNLMREANLEVAEMEKDLHQAIDPMQKDLRNTIQPMEKDIRNAIDPRMDPATRSASKQIPKVDPSNKPLETNSDKND